MKSRTRLIPVVAALVALPAGLGVAASPAMAAADTGHTNSVGMSPNLTNVTPMAIAANERTAFNYFVNKGLTKRQSAGIVGNLIVESGVDPTIKQSGGGPGRGIAQWGVGGRWDHNSRDNMVWYAAQHGQSRWSLGAQLAFTWYELRTFSGYGYSALKSATTISAATVAFEKKFEGCGSCNESRRISEATSVFNTYGGGSANPYQPAEVCGDGYKVIDKHALGTLGTIYLLYKSSAQANCVVTMKQTKLGSKTPVAATLQVQGGTKATNSGNFGYYAGPVKRTAAAKCVKWGGTVNSTTWTSAYSHCG
ncbi:MAG TPA: phage tail tip lysozyme [Flexivirga sp.]|uniref:phage tail tip lysozyme n=1 Tax=Flexivirga sp. TaxID=1962927 RepID=UPI002CAE9C8D|nr:phage tail tip lysozyme [Flexivirga sp.]HWC22473.1 phage tail tip lysozyme [Flexivirga sp.]